MEKREGKTAAGRKGARTPQNKPQTNDSAELRQKLLGLADPKTSSGRAMMLVEQILKPTSSHRAASALFELLQLTGWQDEHDERHVIAFHASFHALFFRDDWLPGMNWLLDKIYTPRTQTNK
jgi:hypothetical protein